MNFFHTKEQLKTSKPTGDLLAYCLETNSSYVFIESSTLPIDDHQVLITGFGGNTRWFAIHQTFNNQTKVPANLQRQNMRIDTGRSTIDNYISNRELTKTITFNTQFSNTPRVVVSKIQLYSMSVNNFRESNLYTLNISQIGFTVACSGRSVLYQNGDYLEADWIAIGSY